MRDYTATMIGILTVVVLALVMAFLLGCESPAPADHTAPDLEGRDGQQGECVP